MGRVEDMYLLHRDAEAEGAAERMVAARDRPYDSPARISDPALAKQIARDLMNSGIWDMTGDDVMMRRWTVLEAHVLSVLEAERRAGRRT